ncbi:hypothetical protein, partial [Pseudonocardia sp. EV170527-09]|uniref:hypothetical protein n=1 Tax=Pseudonocardia sp. EV170527-09 TaxID=2603411 RepID=UPI001960E0BC
RGASVYGPIRIFGAVRISQCSMDRFVHEQGIELSILIGGRRRVIVRLTRELSARPGKPRQATVCGHGLYEASGFFPQNLWIAVCISCKFER